jgi:hypothetical protein
MMDRYFIVQPYGRKRTEATVVESFDDLTDAFEALDGMIQRLHEQDSHPASFGFKVTAREFRPVERPAHGA